MLDIMSVAGRPCRLASRPRMAAVGALLLLLAAMPRVPGVSFVASAVAQSERAESPLNAAQRRVLVARLSDKLKALKRDVDLGQKRVRTDVNAWQGDVRNPTVASIFSGAVRPLPDGADNIYEAAIKEYVQFKRRNRREEWNAWPRDDKFDAKHQQEYAKCVLDRIDYLVGAQWKYMELVIASVQQNNPEIIGETTTLSEAIRTAVTFKGAIQRYLQGSSISDKIPLPDKGDLDWTLRCPTATDPGEAAETAVNTEPLSVDWSAKCLQSDKVNEDGTVKPYHPTTAALMYNDGRTGPATYCSGTLIAPNAVLTAAHCICDTGAKDARGSFYRTAGACANGSYSRLGRSVPTLVPAHQTVFFPHVGHFDISSIVVHPQFRWLGQFPVSDVAIVFLKKPVPVITPMLLNTLGRVPANTKAAAVGYGAHNPLGASGAVINNTTVLETAELKLQANTVTGRCGLFQRARNHICWQYKPSDRFGMRLGSTCRGDSGGPLYAESRGQTYLVGVTSGGGPSCQPDSAAFDIEVYAYRDWIQRQLKTNPPPPGGGSGSARSTPAGSGDGMRQIACHFCPLCDRLEAPITIPDNARRLRVSVNCTPDDITWRSELDLEIFAEPPGIDRDDNLCSDKGPGGTAVTCQVENVNWRK